jgi:SAM-dependent methyltransferase
MDNRHKILDLGCGNVKVSGAVGLDNIALPEVDIVHDLLHFPYPIKANSFDTIYLRHVIEHFNIDKINNIMNECYRILTKDGQLYINVPHVFSIAAFTDPTHKQFFTFGSGYFWGKKYQKSYYNEIDSSWELVNVKCSRITWFDWKHYQFKRLDKFLSSLIRKRINRALRKVNNPSLADRIIRKYNFQFCEIQWMFRK